MIHTSTRPVLAALIESRREWISLEEIATATGFDQSAVDFIVDSLIKNGYLDAWVRKSSTVVTFSCWGAWKLGYRLTENGARNRNRLRWVKRKKGKTDLDPPRRRHREMDLRPAEAIPDDRPGPEQVAAERDEEAVRFEAKRTRAERRGTPLRIEDVPRPRIILTGHSGFPWSETDDGDVPSGYCPECNQAESKNKHLRANCQCRRWHRLNLRPGRCVGCHGAKLSRSTYCSRCRRWGWDDYFRTPAKERQLA